MNDICTTCGHWRGLHHWQTMQCPVNGNETGQFKSTTYTEENEELAALHAENVKLREALEELMHAAVKIAEKHEPDGNRPIWAYIADASDALKGSNE